MATQLEARPVQLQLAVFTLRIADLGICINIEIAETRLRTQLDMGTVVTIRRFQVQAVFIPERLVLCLRRRLAGRPIRVSGSRDCYREHRTRHQ